MGKVLDKLHFKPSRSHFEGFLKEVDCVERTIFPGIVNIAFFIRNQIHGEHLLELLDFVTEQYLKLIKTMFQF